MSEVERPAPAAEPAVSEPNRAQQHLRGARRAHNLLIFVVIGGALLCLLAAQVGWVRRGLVSERLRILLIVLRIGVPVAMLVITAIVTSRVLRRAVQDHATSGITLDALAPRFVQCKRWAMVLMTLAGLFADVCLLFEPRTMDLVLAAIPLMLLLVNRPMPSGLHGFAALALSDQSEQDE